MIIESSNQIHLSSPDSEILETGLDELVLTKDNPNTNGPKTKHQKRNRLKGVETGSQVRFSFPRGQVRCVHRGDPYGPSSLVSVSFLFEPKEYSHRIILFCSMFNYMTITTDIMIFHLEVIK